MLTTFMLIMFGILKELQRINKREEFNFMDLRKEKEKELHNQIRNEALIGTQQFDDLNSNKKWYSVTRKSRGLVNQWLSNSCKGKKVLDYCCGNGEMSIEIAKMGV